MSMTHRHNVLLHAAGVVHDYMCTISSGIAAAIDTAGNRVCDARCLSPIIKSTATNGVPGGAIQTFNKISSHNVIAVLSMEAPMCSPILAYLVANTMPTWE